MMTTQAMGYEIRTATVGSKKTHRIISNGLVIGTVTAYDGVIAVVRGDARVRRVLVRAGLCVEAW